MVDACRSYRQQASDVLRYRRVGHSAKALSTDSTRNELVASNIVTVVDNVVVVRRVLLLARREEHCAGIGESTVLLPCTTSMFVSLAYGGKREVQGTNEPKVVAADGRLEAGAQSCISVVLTQLKKLVDLTLSIAEIGSLRVTQMNPKALRRANSKLSVCSIQAHD